MALEVNFAKLCHLVDIARLINHIVWYQFPTSHSSTSVAMQISLVSGAAGAALFLICFFPLQRKFRANETGNLKNSVVMNYYRVGTKLSDLVSMDRRVPVKSLYGLQKINLSRLCCVSTVSLPAPFFVPQLGISALSFTRTSDDAIINGEDTCQVFVTFANPSLIIHPRWTQLQNVDHQPMSELSMVLGDMFVVPSEWTIQ